MLDIESLAVDPTAAEEGVWATFMGAKFKIARYNSDRVNFLRSKLTLDKWDALTAGDENSDAIANDIAARVLSEAVLIEWEGVSKGGEPLPYSAEVGYEYLINPRFRDLNQFIENFSMNRANFRERAEEEVAESVKDSAAS